MEGMTILNEANFDAYVKEHDGIVLFHKKLCPHCKVLGTVLEKVKAQMPELNLACADSEDDAALMTKVGAERVPTVVVYKGGVIKDKFTGIKNPKEMMAFYLNA